MVGRPLKSLGISKYGHKGFIKDFANTDKRTLVKILTDPTRGTSHAERVYAAATARATLVRDLAALQAAKLHNTALERRVDKYMKLYDTNINEMWQMSDEQLNNALLEFRHALNLQTRSVYGELNRRQHVLEAMAAANPQMGSVQSLMKAVNFDRASGQYADDFFKILSRAYERDDIKSLYYSSGGYATQLFREFENSFQGEDWNDIIERAKSNYLQSLSSSVVLTTEEEDKAFYN